MMNRILIVDDDINNCKRMKKQLKNDLTEIYYATTIRQCFNYLQKCIFTMLIIDVYLNELYGKLILDEISRLKKIPIIVMSSKGNREKKPAVFYDLNNNLNQELNELEKRMIKSQSLLRYYMKSNSEEQQPVYTIVSCKGLTMYPEFRTAYYKGVPLKLNRKEYDTLQLLAGNPGRVITYEQIFGYVWNEEYPGNANIISKHISRLRKKGIGVKIEAVHDLGYRIS